MNGFLRTEGVVKIYSRRKVVNDVSIEVNAGEIVGLLGPNGAGKTTTFYMIVGMIQPNSGRIYLRDEDITSRPMYKRARMGIGYLPQEPSIFRGLTVEQNLMAILETMSMSKAKREELLESLLNELDIAHLRKSLAYNLSGGERRRVEITRALVSDPKVMLLDEPFAGIDPIAVADLQLIVKKLKERGLGILITDHNVRDTLSITDRAYIMYEGSIKRSGTADELAGDAEVREIYLGEAFRL
ncbi:MAG: LPS export ABC transporter ATP-binding protein [Candidatus Latescibacteria bacterium]|nr:LPS export ABC transporter ATP-binding protein [Candidatus Latescibacterota bacterium]NIM22090.1 LPS export ABC transporter ATP-binding protein [Candidatus Latescibacterota bacterium]NIM66109.1 LPS export ABC transporter ATP-binding protein [Candidatus Latescibacterota bacterium]NIO02517.1 LPS export ABC transporter ATP-binding protein [Candidatus Latescibacterota bacterium]NIO29428.1 LPS export ABC transporter ATP-binding protein [Candidatus Latescibacterota bacterium]